MHSHAEPHEGHDHSHGHREAPQETRRLALAIVITLTIAGVQAAGGWIAGSVVLLADSAHMLTDALALALAWFAVRWSRRPPDARYSYGGARFSALAAFVNGLGILGIGCGLAFESIEHLRNPVPVDARLMLGVALVGGASNLIVLKMLGHDAHAHGSLNMRAAALHVASDLLGSVAAVVAALTILLTGWVLADPIASLLVTLLIWRSGLRILRESAHVLLEAVPKNFDAAALERDLLANVPEISSLHHLHVWSLSGVTPLLSLHAVLRGGAHPDAVREKIQQRLRQEHHITHATVQIELAPCVDACSAVDKH